MKRLSFRNLRILLVILTIGLCLPHGQTFAQTSSPAASAPNQRHQVIFQFTSEGEEQATSLLNNIENIQQALGADRVQIEVAAHGKGLSLLTKESSVAARLEKIAGTGVVFAACENTMKRKKIGKEQLLPSATTVDSGVAEVVRKQAQGWAYIKSGD